jgi:hypothetical protein
MKSRNISVINIEIRGKIAHNPNYGLYAMIRDNDVVTQRYFDPTVSPIRSSSYCWVNINSKTWYLNDIFTNHKMAQIYDANYKKTVDYLSSQDITRPIQTKNIYHQVRQYDDKLYVDNGEKIDIYLEDCTLYKSINAPFGALQSYAFTTYGALICSYNNLFFPTGKNPIIAYDKDWRIVYQIENNFKYQDMAVNSMDQIFMTTNSDRKKLHIYTPDFQLLSKFGLYGSSIGKFREINGICVDTFDNIIINDIGNKRLQIILNDN